MTERSITGQTETKADDDLGLDTVKVLVEAEASIKQVSKNLREMERFGQFLKSHLNVRYSFIDPQ